MIASQIVPVVNVVLKRILLLRPKKIFPALCVWGWHAELIDVFGMRGVVPDS